MKNFKKLTLLVALAAILPSSVSASWFSWSKPTPTQALGEAATNLAATALSTGLGYVTYQFEKGMPEGLKKQMNMRNIVNGLCAVGFASIFVLAKIAADKNQAVANAINQASPVVNDALKANEVGFNQPKLVGPAEKAQQSADSLLTWKWYLLAGAAQCMPRY